MKELETIPVEDRVYVDQTGCDQRLVRAHGWSARGELCLGVRSGKARRRLSLVAAYQKSASGKSASGKSASGKSASSPPRLMAPLSFEGTCHYRLFEVWLRLLLCPLLRAGQVVILDNARFHRKTAVARILKRVGCRALFLPPYSPDLNQIEHQWHPFKTRVCANRLSGMSFQEAFEAALV